MARGGSWKTKRIGAGLLYSPRLVRFRDPRSKSAALAETLVSQLNQSKWIANKWTMIVKQMTILSTNIGLHWLAISCYCVSNLNDGNCLSGNLWQHGNGCQHVDAWQHRTTHDDTRTTMTSAKSPRAGCRQSMGRQEIVQAWRLERKCRSLVVNVGHNAGLCHQIWAHFNMSRLSSAHLQT